ncbi:YebC-like protein [Cenococcum geophilum 1.58]|uniref:YebC-like protein n=1 Tax=Cenococcum geophilum 1.58 TaxID=794803 RepID=UPI00358E5E87|nr:YebC-like protein [Cenococcum geophilum 1.58]
MSAAPRRLLARTRFSDPYTCSACRRCRFLSTPASLQSGHNKWSTIKHDKGKNDAAKNKQRSIFSHEISTASKIFGPDPNINPRLALAISTAKKAGVPKSLIESAIARGQGISASGAALESVVVEAMLPPAVATVIDCQTDNKLRTLADIRLLIKEHEGSVTPTTYLFEKKGRIVFREKDGVGVEEVLEEVLEAGALDVIENSEGKVVVFTETNETKATAQALASSLGLEISETDIIWDPTENTKVELEEEEAAKRLGRFLEELQEISGVQGVYMNIAQGSIDDALWSELQSRIIA